MKNIILSIAFLYLIIPVNAQSLGFSFVTDTIVSSTLPMAHFDAVTEIQNLTTDTVEIEMMRLENDRPSLWVTAMCAIVCYFSAEDSVVFKIPPMQSQTFKAQFTFFDHNQDTAHVKLRVRNLNIPSDAFVQDYYAYDASSISSTRPATTKESLKVFPNPASDVINFQLDNYNNTHYELTILNNLGQVVRREMVNANPAVIGRNELPSGLYFYRLEHENKLLAAGKFVLR